MAKVPLSPESRASFAAKTAMNKGKTPEVREAGAAKLKSLNEAAASRAAAAARAETVNARKAVANSPSRMASRSSARIRTTNVSEPKVSIGPSRSSGLQGREVGKMDHMGGHGLEGGAISAFGGGGLAEQTR